jgi:Holliday junction DNA helicase RuvA
MIAFLRGPVAALGPTTAVIDVGGVGMSVQCTPGTLAGLRVGQVARLATSMVVREDSLTLFGFADDDEKQVFELLQTATGVGPRLAQAMLAVHSPDALRVAVAAGDEKALIAVPGVGRKVAQRLLLELSDRLGAPTGGATTAAVTALASRDGWREQVHGALVGLGYPPRDAEAAVEAVAPQAEQAEAEGATPDVGALLKAALRTFGRR